MKTNDDGKFCMHVMDSHDIILRWNHNYLIGIYLNGNWN